MGSYFTLHTHLTSSLWSSEHQCNNQQDHRCQFCARPCKLSPKFSHRPKLDSRDFARERKIAKSIEKSFAGLLHGGAAAAQWELPPFSGLVKRVTTDFYSTSNQTRILSFSAGSECDRQIKLNEDKVGQTNGGKYGKHCGIKIVAQHFEAHLLETNLGLKNYCPKLVC